MGFSSGPRLGAVEREERRRQAASLFEQGVRQAEVARLLGVSRQAVGQWHTAWCGGGVAALAAKRPGGVTYLTPQQEGELEALLRAGPAAAGWEDQRWTLARVVRVVDERFGVRFTVSGVRRLLERLGWSWQVPKTRAVQRDEEAITAWRTDTWPAVSHPRRPRPRTGGSSSRTRPGPR